MKLPFRILLVDSDPAVLHAFQQALRTDPWEVRTATITEAARRIERKRDFDLIVVSLCSTKATKTVKDAQMLGSISPPAPPPERRSGENAGILLLQRAALLFPNCPRIALADESDKALAKQAINQGEVIRFFLKPLREGEVRVVCQQVRERFEMDAELIRLHHVTQWQNEALRQWADTLEQKVAERTEALRQSEARHAQNEKLAALGQLAGGVAHEINNPLASILVFSRTAQRDLATDHPACEDLLEIERAAHRCKEIVDSLLTFSRRSRPEERTPIDLISLVRQSAPLLRTAAQAAIQYEVGDELPVLHGNAHRLQQAMLNLVTNADQAMGGQGVITVRVYAEDESIVLEVRDQGPGIAHKNLVHVFEPFFTTKPQGQGTGLGLSIVYGIAREHGGEVAAENLETGGTCFRMRIPAAGQGAAEQHAQEPASLEHHASHAQESLNN
jgi:signal transduction histidine kinase